MRAQKISIWIWKLLGQLDKDYGDITEIMTLERIKYIVIRNTYKQYTLLESLEKTE